ncbi:NUDIX domain-containing protein [Sinanaerobacter chloroacetimidivorans]|jgi:ADP-ribose pyrophosphatase|uniref:NUDIX hydrolase n=1 Tax=Sinanaerobacter chloroacetimidivorans TaxID=2818044 RepID=A0A8J7VZJ0_9FIRM|nr:NUDIX hydrolase [Sinanaerobacter chloroacetimidivorans]MBR0596863.1 NUDIX hydrolase [Sinanaerobacter chloroacetimidivorans]
MVFEEKTISSERIYEGRILNVRRDKVTVKDNQTSYREIIEHNGGVALAAVTDDGKMVMVKQFRKAAEKAVLEVPAGKIEAGEDHRLTAERELKEETGYSAREIRFLTSFYSSIGYSTEVIYLYLASGLTPGETDFDDNESIDILEYDRSELKQMVLSGEIEDAKTIAAILLVESIMEK